MFKREADKFSSVLLNDDIVLPWDSCQLGGKPNNMKLRKHVNTPEEKVVYASCHTKSHIHGKSCMAYIWTFAVNYPYTTYIMFAKDSNETPTPPPFKYKHNFKEQLQVKSILLVPPQLWPSFSFNYHIFQPSGTRIESLLAYFHHM